MNKKIRIYGDSVLRKKAKPVDSVSEEEKKILEQMLVIMRESGGVGLAAPQIGLSKRLIVIEYGDKILMLANPEILDKQGCELSEEGCLSFPDVVVKIKRNKKIVVEALNKDNKKTKIHLDDILSRAVQHEIDHLDGKLIIDYVSLLDKFRIRKMMKSLQKRNKK